MKKNSTKNKALIQDLNWYSRKALNIVTKEGKQTPLQFNIFQKRLSDIAQQKRCDNVPVRLIVLKARQVGISTWSAAYTFQQIAQNRFRRAMVIADDADNTENIFKMHQRFYDFMDERIKPMKRYSNRKELVFENPNEAERPLNPGLMSQISCETAGKGTAGRSGTIHLLHATEFAFWPDAPTVITGLFQAVPKGPESAIIIESTANGMEGGKGGEFYTRWKQAEEGGSGFIPVFFPWWEFGEYELTSPPGFTPSYDEKHLMELYPAINTRKLAWRRYKIQNEMGSALINPVDQFNQEYPSCPEDAFLSSGRPVFNAKDIKDLMHKVNNIKPKVGDLNGVLKLIENDRGYTKIFEEPKEGKAYAIGADVAEGLEGGDFSTAFVMDQDWNQVASYCGHIDPDLFGRELSKLGKFYNDAVVAPEINNHGHATLAYLKKNYNGRIYYEMIKEKDADDYTKRLGWRTTRKSKHKMLDDFVAAVRDNNVDIKDKSLLREMLTLQIEPDGDVILNSKDLTVSACICIQAIGQARVGKFDPFVPGKSKPKTFVEQIEAWQLEDENGGYFE